MCNNVQKYDKDVYLRVSEAQRCRVHSTLVMPVFDGPPRPSSLEGGEPGGCGGEAGRPPVAVFEVVQTGREVMFPEVMAWLRASLQVRRRGPRPGGGGCGRWDGAWARGRRTAKVEPPCCQG
jgi:hypothetical protein